MKQHSLVVRALLRVEHVLIKTVLSPELRPIERKEARVVLAKVAGRVGVPSALVGVLVNALLSGVHL